MFGVVKEKWRWSWRVLQTDLLLQSQRKDPQELVLWPFGVVFLEVLSFSSERILLVSYLQDKNAAHVLEGDHSIVSGKR